MMAESTQTRLRLITAAAKMGLHLQERVIVGGKYDIFNT
jgi:hypothetical protein